MCSMSANHFQHTQLDHFGMCPVYYTCLPVESHFTLPLTALSLTRSGNVSVTLQLHTLAFREGHVLISPFSPGTILVWSHIRL